MCAVRGACYGVLDPEQVAPGRTAEQRLTIGDRDGVPAGIARPGNSGERDRPHCVAREIGGGRSQVVTNGAVEPVGAVDHGQARERYGGTVGCKASAHLEVQDQVGRDGRAGPDGQVADGDVRGHSVHFCDAISRAVAVADAASLTRLEGYRGPRRARGTGLTGSTGRASDTGRAIGTVLAVVAFATGQADRGSERQHRNQWHTRSRDASGACKFHG